MKTQGSPLLCDEINHTPQPPKDGQSKSKEEYHIIFVPGNPGLISYYACFLSLLHGFLNDPSSYSATPSDPSNPPASVGVHGRSLAGFELFPSQGPQPQSGQFYNVEDQIRHLHRTISDYADTVQPPTTLRNTPSSQDTKTKQKPKIILIGHSVGTYFILSLLSLLHSRHPLDNNKNDDDDAKFEISAAILLFPTVVDILDSPNGQRLGWLLRLIRALRLLPVIGLVVRGFLWVLGRELRGEFMKWAMPRNGIRDGDLSAQREVGAGKTVAEAYLRSKRGVAQCLYLAADEMDVIRGDAWDERVWGSAGADGGVRRREGSIRDGDGKKEGTKSFFFFGRKDRWVAERTREDLIAARGRVRRTRTGGVLQGGYRDGDDTDEEVKEEGDDWKPHMETDDQGIPHEFCIGELSSKLYCHLLYVSNFTKCADLSTRTGYSRPIAEKVAEYVREIIEADSKS